MLRRKCTLGKSVNTPHSSPRHLYACLAFVKPSHRPASEVTSTRIAMPLFTRPTGPCRCIHSQIEQSSIMTAQTKCRQINKIRGRFAMADILSTGSAQSRYGYLFKQKSHRALRWLFNPHYCLLMPMASHWPPQKIPSVRLEPGPVWSIEPTWVRF